MEVLYAVGAGLIVLVHLSFVLFAAAGALLSLKWPRAIWGHVPAVAWAAYIEFSGGICPLTPLENAMRARAGLDYYTGDFVARYLFPVLYPEGLTRGAQNVIGAVVLALNVGLYAFIHVRRTRRSAGARTSRNPAGARFEAPVDSAARQPPSRQDRPSAGHRP